MVNVRKRKLISCWCFVADPRVPVHDYHSLPGQTSPNSQILPQRHYSQYSDYSYNSQPDDYELSPQTPSAAVFSPTNSFSSIQPLLGAPSVEYPVYLGTSAPGRRELTWLPFTMRWPYLLFNVTLLAIAIASLLWLTKYSITHYGFDVFHIHSLEASVVFKVLPAVVVLVLQMSWTATDQSFRRITPFINMANPVPGRRRCLGSKNPYPGARGKRSLLLNYFPYSHYFKDLYMGCQGHWAVATSTGVVSMMLFLIGASQFLFIIQDFNIPTPVNGTPGLSFQRMADWQQRLDIVYASDLGKKLAISELGLVLSPSVESSRKYRRWSSAYWSVVPFILVNETDSEDRYRSYPGQWETETVVFHGTLECEPASSQNEVRDGSLLTSFKDSVGCSAQQVYPQPPAGQYLSFWNTTGRSTTDKACRDRQLLAWGKASSPSTVDWTALSCSPKYRTATTNVLVEPAGLYLPPANPKNSYTSNISRSVFPRTASDFSSPELTAFIHHVFLESGLASIGNYPASQAPFFRGIPKFNAVANPNSLLDQSNLTSVVQNSFQRVASRIFTIGLFTANSALADSPSMVRIPNGIQYNVVTRWSVPISVTILTAPPLILGICGAIGLLLSVAFMKKYQVTGLKFDVSAAGTAGLMLLFHRSGRVLHEDFKDLDQATKASDLTKRLGEKLYRLGYWQDANGVFWGISREAGQRGVAKWTPHHQIPRLPPEKLSTFRHRQGRFEVHIASVITILSIAIGFEGIYLYLLIRSSGQQGIDPIVDPRSTIKLSMLWSVLPSYVTIYIFKVWWDFVDMYFRSTQPFADLRAPRPANENIATDYRSMPSLFVPFVAASRRRWRLSLVTCVSLLISVMAGIAGALFKFDTVPVSIPVRFVRTHAWKMDNLETPTLEPYLYQSANILRGSDAWSSWADHFRLYLPVKPDNVTVPPTNLTTPTWQVDTQRVLANFPNCINLEHGVDITANFSTVQLGGLQGVAIKSVSLKKGSCASETNIIHPCGRSNGTIAAAIPNDVCSFWKLLPENGKCDYDGWWWIYWQSGKALGYDPTGLPVFASTPPPVSTSLLCHTSIWLSDVTVSIESSTGNIFSPSNITAKRSRRFENITSGGKDYQYTFNSLLSSALTATRATSDSTDLMAVMMEGLSPNRTHLSSPDKLIQVASMSYSNLFSIYTRNENILWSALNGATTPLPTTNGTISWHTTRVFTRPKSFGLYSICLLVMICTIAIIGPSLKDRRLPRWVASIADVVTYFYRSPIILDDFYGLDADDVASTELLVTRLMQKGRKYVFGDGIGRDGVPFVGIGEESRVVYGESKGRDRR